MELLSLQLIFLLCTVLLSLIGFLWPLVWVKVALRRQGQTWVWQILNQRYLLFVRFSKVTFTHSRIEQHCKPIPVMKTGFSLCTFSHREKPVSISWDPCNENRFFPVGKKYTGKSLFWPCTDPVRDCSARLRISCLLHLKFEFSQTQDAWLSSRYFHKDCSNSDQPNNTHKDCIDAMRKRKFAKLMGTDHCFAENNIVPLSLSSWDT
jgi:hypothetical protein